MSDSVASIAPKKPRRWVRRLIIGFSVFLALMVIGYFVVTSSAFFKGVILPRAGKSMHATITVSDASISPFSQVVLRGLKVQTTGTEPLVSAQEARLRYSLVAILGGNLRVAEVTLDSPTVTIVRNPDGTSNLDPITQSSGGAQKQERDATRKTSASQPPQIELGKFALNKATVRLITLLPGGRDVVEVSNLNVSLDNLKNGQTAKLAVAADLLVDKQAPSTGSGQATAPGPRASLQAKLDSSGELALGQDLSIASLKTRSRLQIPQAAGALSEVTGSSFSFETDLSADPNKKTAVLRSVNLQGARRDTILLQTFQSGPFNVSWGSGQPAVSDATLSLVLTNLNLADWRGLAPGQELAGRGHATLQLSSQQTGAKIGIVLAAALEQLGGKFGTNLVTNLQLRLSANGQVSELSKVEFSDYRLALIEPQGTNAIATINGKLAADVVKQTADVEARVGVNLAKLLGVLPQGGLNLKSGQLQLDAKVSQRDPILNAAGTLRVQSLAGVAGNRSFQDLGLSTEYDVSVTNHQQVELRRVLLTLAPTERVPTNAVALAGRLDLSKPTALAGALKLSASALDLTPYYDLYEGLSASPSQSTTTTTPDSKSPPPAPGPETEPPAVALPVRLLTADVAVDRCYLREVVITDVRGMMRIETNRITLPPWSLALNSAPVSAEADINLGVAGYEYAVAFNGDRIPLEPLANSFSPTYRGQAKGEVLAAFKIRGAGVTGPSLQKNLAGALNLSFTNAEIQLVGARAKALLTPIALGLGYQDIFKSPLRWLGTEAKVTGGKIQLNQFDLVSPAFTAATRGEIPLVAKLADSPIRDWPVELAIPRSLAERLKLAAKGAVTNEFVPLPNFVKAVGTLGNARTKTDPVALVQFGARAIADLPGVSPEASRLIKQADSLLGGKTSAQTNNPSGATNSIGTLPGKLGDLFKPKNK